ncbi:MAG: type II toxin-antitoxin system RelE/ParE family toxin [Rhizomicrobium sp.]
MLFCIRGDKMVLLHGFIKKSQSTPQKELTLARNRMKAVKRQARGGKDEEEQEEPAHWVQPRVVPRGGRHSRAGKDDGDQARARLAISELMKKQRVSKVTMAKRMRTKPGRAGPAAGCGQYVRDIATMDAQRRCWGRSFR